MSRNRKPLTGLEFKMKAKEIHGDFYDYSNILDDEILSPIYKKKIMIICPKHGTFEQIVGNHLHGCGCPLCGIEKSHILSTKTTAQFIEDAKKVHGDKYDYGEVDYISDSKKVKIICPEHGEFWQTPNTHLHGGGCRKCGIIETHNKQRKSREEFISEARAIHGDKYNYDKVIYSRARSLVCITCPEHGDFYQTPSDHLRGRGCNACSGKNRELKDLISEFNQVHDFRYDYSKVTSTRAKDKVEIICPEHGSFFQKVESHRKGCGCPKCKTSTMELEVMSRFKSEGIVFEYQKTFDWFCNSTNNYHFRYDFYLPDYSIAIECQGIQHFLPVDFFGGEEGLQSTILRDNTKKALSMEHKINILYYSNVKGVEFPYSVIESIDELVNIIKSKNKNE